MFHGFKACSWYFEAWNCKFSWYFEAWKIVNFHGVGGFEWENYEILEEDSLDLEV